MDHFGMLSILLGRRSIIRLFTLLRASARFSHKAFFVLPIDHIEPIKVHQTAVFADLKVDVFNRSSGRGLGASSIDSQVFNFN